MAEFRWRGVNQLQQQQNGTLLADNHEQAQALLLARGLQQLKIRRNWRLLAKVQLAEIAELLQQLAMLLQAGLPLNNSLLILRDSCQGESLLNWLNSIIRQIDRGYTFSQALQQNPQFLNHRDRQMIKIGETSGQLVQLCQQIAHDKTVKVALQRKLQKILLYPLFVLVISLGLTVLLLLFIVPQFAEMYQQNQQQLPHFTHILLQLSDFLQQYGGRLTLLCGLSGYGISYSGRHNLQFRLWLQRLIVHIPVFGRLNQLSYRVDSSRNLALMLNAGIALSQALQIFIATDKDGFNPLQQEMSNSLQLLQQGYPFSHSISSRWFPQQAQQMIRIGEQSGCLAQMLQHIGDNDQRQLDHQIDLLSQLLEPLLMLFIGGLIGSVMLGMYLPIFNMGAMFG